MSGDDQLIVPPEWSTPSGMPAPEEIERMTSRLDASYRRRKAAEIGERYPVPGGDFDWFSPTPPSKAWVVEGVLCAIAPAPMPMMCGYVQIPRDHPWGGRDLTTWTEDAPDIDVHGGVTWHHAGTDWIGFDTGHAWDHWSQVELDRCREAGLVGDGHWHHWVEYQQITRDTGVRDIWAADPHSRRWTFEQVIAETVNLATIVKAAW